MKVYNYNKDTKEYISTTQASKNPLEKGKYLIPANATTIAIGIDKDGFAQVFDEVKNVWSYVEDNRGKTVYGTTTKEKSTIDYLGAIKSVFTELVPKRNDKWDGKAWIIDMKLASDDKISSIRQDYETANQIDIDYMSTTFQADKASQELIVAVLSAGSVPAGFFWLDINNVQVTMTYAELQGLSGTILGRSQINFIHFQDLKTQINAATTQAELDLIVW